MFTRGKKLAKEWCVTMFVGDTLYVSRLDTKENIEIYKRNLIELLNKCHQTFQLVIVHKTAIPENHLSLENYLQTNILVQMSGIFKSIQNVVFALGQSQRTETYPDNHAADEITGTIIENACYVNDIREQFLKTFTYSNASGTFIDDFRFTKVEEDILCEFDIWLSRNNMEMYTLCGVLEPFMPIE